MPGFNNIQNEIDQLEADYVAKRQLSEAHKQRGKAIAKKKLATPWVLIAALGIGLLAGRARIGATAAKTAKTVAGPGGRNIFRLGRLAIGPALAYMAKRSAERDKQSGTQ